MRKIRLLVSAILIFAMMFTFAGCRKKEADVEGLRRNPNTIIKYAMQNSLQSYKDVAYNPLHKGTEAIQGGEIVTKVVGQDGEEIVCTLTRSAVNSYFKTQYSDNGNEWGCVLYKDTVYIQPNLKEETYYSLPLTDLTDSIDKSQLPEILGVSTKRIEKRIYEHYETMLRESVAGTSAEDVNQRHIDKLLDLVIAQAGDYRAEKMTAAGQEQNVAVAEYTIDNATMLQIGLMLEEWAQARTGADKYIDDVFFEVFAQSGVELKESEREKEMSDKALDNLISEIKYSAKYKNAAGKVVFYLDATNEKLLKISANFSLPSTELPLNLACDITFFTADKNSKKIEIVYESTGDTTQTLGCKLHWTLTKEQYPTKVSELTTLECKIALSTWKEVRGMEFSKKDNSFVYRSMYNNEELILAGSISAMDEMRMQINKITYANKEYSVNISVTGTPKEIKCKTPGATSIFALSNSEISALQKVVLSKYPKDIFGDWSSVENNDDKYYTFDPNYDYDKDGDVDADDKALFDAVNSMLQPPT